MGIILRKKQREEAKLQREVRKIEIQIEHLKQQEQALKTKIAQISKEIQKTNREKNRLQKKLNQIQNRIQQRLLAIYQWERIGPLNLIAIQSVSQYLLSSAYLEQLISKDRTLILKYTSINQDLTTSSIALKGKLRELQEKQKELNRLKTQITHQKIEKDRLLKKVKRLRLKYARRIKRLKKNALRLERVIKRLKKQRLKKRVKIVRGHMPWPVRGKVVVPFGQYRDKLTGRFLVSNGIEIKVAPNTPFRAVAAGKVVYANWLYSYGNIIIIDHGRGYYTLYAHAISLYKKEGQWVNAGDILGRVGGKNSVYGTTLYFELRHHSKPIDPFVWLKPQ